MGVFVESSNAADRWRNKAYWTLLLARIVNVIHMFGERSDGKEPKMVFYRFRQFSFQFHRNMIDRLNVSLMLQKDDADDVLIIIGQMWNYFKVTVGGHRFAVLKTIPLPVLKRFQYYHYYYYFLTFKRESNGANAL